MTCPRCQQSLRARSVSKVPVRHCAACDGLLVDTKHTIQLVQALAKQLDALPGPDDVIEPVPHDGLTLRCPQGHEMSSSGYMGARIAVVDRCDICSVLFIDGPEVEPLVRQYMRSFARAEDRRAFYEKEQEEMDRRVSEMLLARARTRSMGGGIGGF